MIKKLIGIAETWLKKRNWHHSVAFSNGDGNIYVVADPSEFFKWDGRYDILRMACIQPVIWSFPSWKRVDTSLPFESQDKMEAAGYVEVDIKDIFTSDR